MTSTSVTKVGGVLVVTQVIPQEESSIPLQTPPTQPPAPVKQAPPPAFAKVDDMTASFLRGEPQGLGVSRSQNGRVWSVSTVTLLTPLPVARSWRPGSVHVFVQMSFIVQDALSLVLMTSSFSFWRGRGL